jgi:hypothetical protein
MIDIVHPVIIIAKLEKKDEMLTLILDSLAL